MGFVWPFAGPEPTPSKPEGDWRLLEPISYENLTVFPVVSSAGYDTSAFLTLEDGLSTGEVTVREQGAETMIRDRNSGRGRQKVLYREPRHLRQVTHGRLAGIRLPVGVGNEADRGIERRVRAQPRQVLWVKRQRILQPLQGVDQNRAQCVKNEKRDRVLRPAHFTARIDAAQSV